MPNKQVKKRESKLNLTDKCDNCEDAKSDKYWDYEDNTVLCEACHSKIGKQWQEKIDSEKSKIASKEPLDDSIKGVGGWLGFFIFGMCISILINLYSGISDIAGIIALNLPIPWMSGLIVFDILLFGGLISFMIYTIVCVTGLKSNAVSTAKKYLIFMLVSSILAFILEAYNPTAYTTESSIAGGSVRGIIFGAIWLAYFSNSKRVANTFPESRRKSTLIENIWFYSLLFLQAILFIFSLISGNAAA